MDIEVGNYNEEEINEAIRRLKEKMEAYDAFDEKFKEKYGIAPGLFFMEFFYVLEHSDMKYGTTNHGNVITADYLSIEIFIDKIVEEVKKYEEHR